MAEAPLKPLKLDCYKETLRETDRRIAPENPNDFAEILVSDIERTERLMSSVSVTPEKAKQYKERIRRFIIEVDGENYQKLSQDLHGRLEALYKEMEAEKNGESVRPGDGLEPPKPEEVKEQLEIPKMEIESFESHLRVGAEIFNISDPNQIPPAATALQKVEAGFIDAGKKLSERFQDVHEKVQIAQKASADANIIDWFGSIFSDSDEKEIAEAVTTEVRQIYEDSLLQLSRQRIEVTNATHRLIGAASNYLLRIDEGEQTVFGYRQKVDEGKSSFASASKSAREFSEKIRKERVDIGTKFERDKIDFRRKISEIERQIEEVRKKRTAQEERERKLRDERDAVEKRLDQKDLDQKDREKFEHERNYLDSEIAKFSEIYGELDDAVSRLTFERDAFLERRDARKIEFDSLVVQMDEQKGAREKEVTEFGQQKEEAERYSTQLGAFALETKERMKNLTELRGQMDLFFHEWRDGNSQMMEALNQQKAFLENVQIEKPSLFSSLWNTPILGKWGILGAAVFPLRAVPMVISAVDDLTGGVISHEWKKFSDMIDSWAESSKKAGGIGSVFAGIVSGTKDLGAGFYQFAAEPMKALDGFGSMIIHPEKFVEMGKMLLEFDEFSQGNTGYAAGRLVPTLVLTLASGGVGSGATAVSQGVKGVSLIARMGTGAKAFLAAGGEKITFGSATKALAKGAFVDLPVSAVRGAYDIVKGTGKMLLEPFYIYRNVGRGIYGAVCGLEGRELQMFVSQGKKGLMEYQKSLQATREEMVARKAALEPGGVLDTMAQERFVLYEREIAHLDSEIGTASSAEMKLGIKRKIPDKVPPPIETSKIPVEPLKGAEAPAGEAPAREVAAKDRLGGAKSPEKKSGMLDKISAYRRERDILNRRMETLHCLIGLEKNGPSVSRYLEELYTVEKEFRGLSWKYGKEVAGAMPGVETSARIFGGIRTLLRKAVDVAGSFGRGARDALQYVANGHLKDALTTFFKNSAPEVRKFFHLIADNWSMYPAGMREMLLKRNESLFDKFVIIANRYPAVSRFIVASPFVRAEQLEEAIRINAEDDFSRETVEFFEKVSGQKVPQISFEKKIPDRLQPLKPNDG